MPLVKCAYCGKTFKCTKAGKSCKDKEVCICENCLAPEVDPDIYAECRPKAKVEPFIFR